MSHTEELFDLLKTEVNDLNGQFPNEEMIYDPSAPEDYEDDWQIANDLYSDICVEFKNKTRIKLNERRFYSKDLDKSTRNKLIEFLNNYKFND